MSSSRAKQIAKKAVARKRSSGESPVTPKATKKARNTGGTMRLDSEDNGITEDEDFGDENYEDEKDGNFDEDDSQVEEVEDDVPKESSMQQARRAQKKASGKKKDDVLKETSMATRLKIKGIEPKAFVWAGLRPGMTMCQQASAINEVVFGDCSKDDKYWNTPTTTFKNGTPKKKENEDHTNGSMFCTAYYTSIASYMTNLQNVAILQPIAQEDSKHVTPKKKKMITNSWNPDDMEREKLSQLFKEKPTMGA
jgi:hypothetical protein